MDDVQQIKNRLPIEQLVGSYCQLHKKGRSFVALCPFHNDSKPSLLVSPDKGIAYCFACQSGGDIFSFYQKIEGVDFQTAIRDLAERAGVKLEIKAGAHVPKKDDKDRARECLKTALTFYREQLKSSVPAKDYLEKRAVPQEQIDAFELGVAPDGFTATYDHLLKANHSRGDIVASGLAIQRDLQDQRAFDRFRNRLMFPIHDPQGQLVGFGGRTLGADDAKYINTSDGLLYHKSAVLYAFHKAKESMRETGKAVIVEGYFDVLACHRVGITNTVATCGTALTDQHCKLLRRYVDKVVLCLDSDRAGQEAMERAFPLLAAEGLHVEAVILPEKDPSEILASDPEQLRSLLSTPAAYLDIVIQQALGSNLSDPFEKRQALSRILRLVRSLPSAVERNDYLRKAAAVFQTTETALQQDLQAMQTATVSAPRKQEAVRVSPAELFSSSEIVLGLFCLYPQLRHLLSELIIPQEGLAAALYTSVKDAPADAAHLKAEDLGLEKSFEERVGVLLLYLEDHNLSEWSESMAAREIKNNCRQANREYLRVRQQEIARKLVDARMRGERDEEASLQNQYQELLKLMQKAK